MKVILFSNEMAIVMFMFCKEGSYVIRMFKMGREAYCGSVNSAHRGIFHSCSPLGLLPVKAKPPSGKFSKKLLCQQCSILFHVYELQIFMGESKNVYPGKHRGRD